MNFLKKHWPILIIAAVVLFLAIVNYRPGMILTGGDNLHPEYNFGVNFRRMIFSVWEEYEGVGALAGMGHAADLLRTVFIWLLSFVIPTNLLRYITTMLTLFIGATGAYYLIRKLLSHPGMAASHDRISRDSIALLQNDNHKPSAISHQSLALLGGLFYLLNLATVQQYYTPFEVFTAHFAALPWLFLTTINYFQHTSKRNLLLLALTLFLATGQGYVPTVFVVWLAATGILTLFLCIKVKPFAFRPMPFAKYYVVVFLINAFWLLPFAYFTITNVHVDLTAKINQMGSENIYSLNKEFGNIPDVMLLRGFWFNNVEPDFQGNITYMLLPWRDHMANPIVPIIGYVLFAVIILGLVTAIRMKKRLPLAFVAIFVLAFVMLTTATPPFAQINDFIRALFPLFKEVFRFAFTKFSTLASLTYAIFFAYGLHTILSFWSGVKRSDRISRDPISHSASQNSFQDDTKQTFPLFPYTLIFLLFSTLMVIFMLPAFQGHLIYDREKSTLPTSYQEFFTYMQHQDPNGRVALFPANTFWDWKFYSWGYSGSGFLWYAIPQPVLDRAFDMWGTHNENYYHELSQALYAKDPKAVENVFHKYEIRYILVDKNVIYPPAPQSLFYNDLPDLFSAMPSVKKAATFDTLTVYKVSLPNNPKDFLSLGDVLPLVNTATWNNNDQAYMTLGDYQSPVGTETPTLTYPFRSLFSGKLQSDKAFSMDETADAIVFSTTLPKHNEEEQLSLPSYFKKEAILPATIETKQLPNGDMSIDIAFRLPEIWYAEKKLGGGSILQHIATLPKVTASKSTLININGITDVAVQPDHPKTVFLSLSQDNVFVVSDGQKQQLAGVVIKPEALQNLPGLGTRSLALPATDHQAQFKVIVPKVNDPYISYLPRLSDINHIADCDIFRKGDASAVVTTNNGLGQLQVQAKNATSCTSFYSPSLPHREGYAIFISAEHTVGKGFHFWLVNEDEKFAVIDTYLPEKSGTVISSFVLPPQDEYGTAYSFHLDSVSIGNEETENILKAFHMYQIPYDFLTAITVADNQPVFQAGPRSGSQLTTTHPQETLYTVQLPQLTEEQTLSLGQAFDSGWKVYGVNTHNPSFLALAAPFFGGKSTGKHVMVNGWENGWVLKPEDVSDKTLIIVYLPQYLEYLGFLLLVLTSGYFLFIGLKKSKN